jgi:homospermidine synthase
MQAAKFDGRVLVIGCGAVSQCAMPLLLKLIAVDPKKVTIMDFVDNRERVKDVLAQGVSYIQEQITPANYRQILPEYAGRGDMIIDLAWNIDCCEMLEWCRENSVLYINTSVEQWDPFEDGHRTDPRPYTLYVRQMKMREMLKKWGNNSGSSAIVDHGANPGLVSHFTKRALCEIATRIVKEKPQDSRRAGLEAALAEDNFKKMAQLSNVQVIHISERDTQISNQPKRVNEFVNTWSIAGLYEEGMAPAEMGWGTHERELPEDSFSHEDGPKNQICLTTLGVNTWARSWVPCGEIAGMIIRHGEAFGISDRLTVWEGDKAVYRPTVHYVYCPSDSTIVSLHELKMRQYDMQTEQRILNEEIVSGRDELGVLLMGHDFKSWWTGSLLDIEETRTLAPGQNATTLQVAISVIAGAIWMIRHPKSGINLPDDVDHREILEICMPFLGPFHSEAVDWTPFDRMDMKYTRYGLAAPDPRDCWQFKSFRIRN